MNIDIREPADRDYSAWRALWEGYTQFYNSPQPETVTEHTWRRLLDPQSPVIGRVAVVDGEVLGFAICVLHEGTWVTTPVCSVCRAKSTRTGSRENADSNPAG